MDADPGSQYAVDADPGSRDAMDASKSASSAMSSTPAPALGSTPAPALGSTPAPALGSTLAAALARPARFLEATALRRPAPRGWTTPNRVLREEGAYRLRDFSREPDREQGREPDRAPSLEPGRGRGREPGLAPGPTSTPVLVVPPEVNQSYIVDFNPGQSLVRTILGAGFDRVAALEWRSATLETSRRDIDDSIADILDCIEALGGRVHLIGVCQGGWEAAIAAALRPGAIATLTLVAAPIDFAAGQGMIRQLSAFMPMAAYRALVAAGGGRMAGDLISTGFDGLMPFERMVLGPLAVWTHLEDEAWLDRHHELADWYRSPKDLPGPLYTRAVRELFKENRLAEGRLVVLGQLVDLGGITCPVCLVAGSRDHITPPEQLFGARPRLGSTEVLEVLTDGGHIGTFMGKKELTEHWPGVLAWMGGERAG